MDSKIVCVLDMDETLGFFDEKTFHVRPKYSVFIPFLRLLRCDIILWSLGGDEYVKRVVTGTLTDILKHAVDILSYSHCKQSLEDYNYYKAAEYVRHMYKDPIFLIGVDDKAKQNMGLDYDMLVSIPPYRKHNPHDRALLDTMEKIIQGVAANLPDRETPAIVCDDLMSDLDWF